ncbi:MAG: ImpA family type VI secretion system protein [Succinivibrionaceae bacterium]
MIINEKILEELKKPISDNSFCGTYLKLDRQAFRSLRNIYNVANSASRRLLQTPDESEIEELTEINKESWKNLSDALIDTFKNQTKDIELLSWLMVSQIYVDNSLDGFKNTVSLLKFLVLEHFNDLNPNLPESSLKSEDEAGKSKEIVEFKTLSFNQMIGTGENDSILYAPLSQIALVSDLTYFKYQSAENKGECLKLKQDLNKFVNSNKNELQTLINTIKVCKQDFEEVYKFLNTTCLSHGVSLPNFSFIINHLDKMLKVLSFITDFAIEDIKQDLNSDTINETQENVNTESQVVSQANQATVSLNTAVVTTNAQSFALLAKNNGVTREQIFEELQNIATYFKTSEPHSPVSYLIEKAIRWGHMSLPELMNELMNDEQDTRKRIFTVVGLSNDNDDSNQSGGQGKSSKQEDNSGGISW